MSSPNISHSYTHDLVDCKKRCNRLLECGHPCIDICCLPCRSDCACDKELPSVDREARAADYATGLHGSFEARRKLRDGSQVSGSPQLEDQTYRVTPRNTQPYRDFATGGHVKSDKNLTALMKQEAAEAQGKRLDDRNYAALFSEPGDGVLVDEKIKKMTLVRTMSDGKGGSRNVWKGTYDPGSNNGSSLDKKEETSLLDL